MATSSTEVLDIKKWYQSTFYREAVENVVAYNAQLLKDAGSRLPYLDVQTGIAQRNSHLLRSRLERKRGLLPGQVFSYPQRRWRRETAPVPILSKDLSVVEGTESSQGTSMTPGLIQTVEGGVVTKRSSRIAGMSRKEAPVDGVALPVTVRVPLESPASSEINEEEESPEADMDYMDDADSDLDEKKSGRRKRRAPARIRGGVGSSVAPKSYRGGEGGGDKPYRCSFCSRRYKTAPSLKAHHTQYHGGEPVPAALQSSHPVLPTRLPTPPEPTGPSVPPETRTPVILPPPPNLAGKENAKPNPYCDFCLGDSSKNNKTTKLEKMVSCANCGRAAHPSCMQFSPALAAIVRTYRWQCIECKSCHFCGTSENDDQLLFCDDCDRGYHMYCMKPPIKEPPEGNWSCGRCYKLNV